ncbi:hypothetical protein OSB04_025307 [Centaurea solstitialis]|uniref:APO domain-containing protein n=1 Tax=Centaurea solstitialis TaxID=347529 RepID=A0AA38WB75_9ASTR|nr:hypothetical protein OSB04_025307 [Centaurea solstitialis]
MSCSLISPELGTTFFLCKQRSLPPKLGILRYNPQQDLRFPNSLKFSGKNSRSQRIYGVPSPKIFNAQSLVVKCCNSPQNVDLPQTKEAVSCTHRGAPASRQERMKNRKKGQPKRAAPPPPKSGLLVQRMIPLAYTVLNARTALINNLKKLLTVVPVQACKYCNEIHVGPVGHPFRSCQGQNSSIRKGNHEWVNAVVEDIFVQIEAYHLYDRLGKRIPHEERFSVPRIPALVELCIQAGVDLPDFPTKRRRKPIIRISKSEFIDADESELPDPTPQDPRPTLLTEIPDREIVPPSNAEETLLLAEQTLEAWEKMRGGANRLMKMYPVRVCGYCPEIHVGPTGHKAQNCGAFKHQQRNGQHGWQSAVLNDLIPPRYVWHVPNLEEPLLQKELRNFYGQAPAVVEMCVQAGAAVPEQYKPTMRLDVGIPSSVKEAEMVLNDNLKGGCLLGVDRSAMLTVSAVRPFTKLQSLTEI